MAVRVELPKELLQVALEAAVSLRRRGATAATNTIIREALEQEAQLLFRAKETLQDVK